MVDTAFSNGFKFLKSENIDKTVPCDKSNKAKFYSCQICEKIFPTPAKLKIHSRIHTGEKPFKCDVCDKSFSVNGTLTDHKRIHTGEKPFKCDECGKSFSQNKRLVRHKTIHSDHKPYSCDICMKKFGSKDVLNSHKRTHSKPYSCDICKKLFSRKPNLARHSKIHINKEENRNLNSLVFVDFNDTIKKEMIKEEITEEKCVHGSITFNQENYEKDTNALEENKANIPMLFKEENTNFSQTQDKFKEDIIINDGTVTEQPKEDEVLETEDNMDLLKAEVLGLKQINNQKVLLICILN